MGGEGGIGGTGAYAGNRLPRPYFLARMCDRCSRPGGPVAHAASRLQAPERGVSKPFVAGGYSSDYVHSCFVLAGLR